MSKDISHPVHRIFNARSDFVVSATTIQRDGFKSYSRPFAEHLLLDALNRSHQVTSRTILS